MKDMYRITTIQDTLISTKKNYNIINEISESVIYYKILKIARDYVLNDSEFKLNIPSMFYNTFISRLTSMLNILEKDNDSDELETLVDVKEAVIKILNSVGIQVINASSGTGEVKLANVNGTTMIFSDDFDI